ncbi:hypothetical protein ACOMHN_005218 [Nucella lapillus]
MVGVLLSMLYMGNLLHQCGDVELNPGPGPKTGKTRQSRLDSANGASRRGSVDMQESTSPTTHTPASDPTSIEHVVSILNNLSSLSSHVLQTGKADVCEERKGRFVFDRMSVMMCARGAYEQGR